MANDDPTQKNELLIDGFGIGGYRSFGSLQLIGPLAKVNLLVGPNNSGKSNILRFAHEHLARVWGELSAPLFQADTAIDRHQGKVPSEFSSALAVARPGRLWDGLQCAGSLPGNSSSLKLLEQALFNDESPHIGWLDLRPPTDSGSPPQDLHLLSRIDPDLNLQNLHDDGPLSPVPVRRLNPDENLALRGLYLRAAAAGRFPVHFVPAIREATAEDSQGLQLSGKGIVEWLARREGADPLDHRARLQFGRLNEFVREVVGSPDLRLTVPYNRKSLTVEIAGKSLPLASLGTGIHEVIILAATATEYSGSMVCIEEPEIHLHPILQRKLIRYLAEQTDNQYLIATHSAHILDLPNTNVFHVRMEEGETRVSLALRASERSQICLDLGYRPSDLLQANCVIWVEGPSDRIYLEHWLKAVDADLTRDLHYSIMFYGGSLLSHLTADDPTDADLAEIDDFISLRRLNQQMVVVMDSDRAEEDAPLNAAKRKILEAYETRDGSGFAWVTAGRTIENYIPHETLRAAIKAAHPSCDEVLPDGRYQQHPKYRRKDGSVETANKVRVAREVTKQACSLEVLDLKDHVRKLVNFIRRANGLEEGPRPGRLEGQAS